MVSLNSRTAALPSLHGRAAKMLPFGNGRSYGDSCLNTNETLLSTRHLDHFIDFDPTTGILCCEAGVLLADILKLVVPQGWFLPVTPGTRFVTVGGAIANDVHGKNHHVAGTFGCHVRRFMLRRSDGQDWLCSRDERPEWFAATIGGLGLTGLISWAEIQLRPVQTAWVAHETLRFFDLDEFFALSRESEPSHEYTVAWLDCSGSRSLAGRGLFTRANHAASAPAAKAAAADGAPRTLPFTPPLSLVNTASVMAFNAMYFHRAGKAAGMSASRCESFFYPLDHVLHWNRIYGPKGFYQYQCVVPHHDGRAAIAEMIAQIARSGAASFLSVLKQFGTIRSPGMLSFPQPGVTLAMDFPNTGPRLHALFARLDAVVSAAGGRLYPAKDGRMPGAFFRQGYPDWQRFSSYVDPAFSSSFWRRVTEDA